jgi:hypothetical protein
MDAEPVAAVQVDGVELPNPIHNILITCGVMNAAHCAMFIDIKGLDLVAVFASMSGDPDVIEMAKRVLASSPNVAAWRVILGTMQIERIQSHVY